MFRLFITRETLKYNNVISMIYILFISLNNLFSRTCLIVTKKYYSPRKR